MESKLQLPTIDIITNNIQKVGITPAKGFNIDKHRPCIIKAENDIEAVSCWLKEYEHKKETYRSYKKAGERFLLWCYFQRQKTVSDLDRDDFEAFDLFLHDPQPQTIWCSGRKIPRGQQDWRPFVKPLSDNARFTVLQCINSLMNYLVDACYLGTNPLKLIKRRKRYSQNSVEQQLKNRSKILEDDEWRMLIETINEMPDGNRKEKFIKERLRFIIIVLVYLGLRIDDLATHCWGAFRNIEGNWWMVIIGKGDKLRLAPVNNDLLSEIIHYRRSLGLEPLPKPHEERPIIPSTIKAIIKATNNEGNFITDTDCRGIGKRRLAKLIKDLAYKTAEKFKGQPEKAEKLKRLSPHWFRHLSTSLQARLGVDKYNIKENLGHSSFETTETYLHAFEALRHEDMQKLTLRVR